MVRTKVVQPSQSGKMVPLPHTRDQSPSRTIVDRQFLIIVTAKNEHCSLQTRVRELTIPDSVLSAFQIAMTPIHVEKQLLNFNDNTFTTQQRKDLLGFLKAIGFKMSWYPSTCTNYGQLTALHENETPFTQLPALTKANFVVNFISDEPLDETK